MSMAHAEAPPSPTIPSWGGTSKASTGRGGLRRMRTIWKLLITAVLSITVFSLYIGPGNGVTGLQSITGLGYSRQPKDIHYNLSKRVPITNILAHSPGCTTLDNMYTWNGTIYLVTDSPEKLPVLHHINSGVHQPPEGEHQWDNPEFIQTITPAQAKDLFGTHTTRQRGVTFLIKDTYLQHYAHFTLESTLALWTIYAAGASPDGKSPLPFPERIMFSIMDDPDWRDGNTKMNAFVLKHAFPGAGHSYMRDWQEKAEFGTVDVYDRVVFLDRQGTHRDVHNQRSNKIIAGVALLPHKPDFWQPVRESMLLSLPPPNLPPKDKIVVTYVSRQHAPKGRRLDPTDNTRLEKALRNLGPEYEVNILYFEEYSRTEQIHFAARTDIMLGLHGNGLTHLLWLPPKSLVIEMLFPGGWARDFELPATNIGHYHVAIHNDVLIRGEEMPPAMIVPPGFHDPGLPVRPEPVIAAIKAFAKAKKTGKKPNFPPHRTKFAEGQVWNP